MLTIGIGLNVVEVGVLFNSCRNDANGLVVIVEVVNDSSSYMSCLRSTSTVDVCFEVVVVIVCCCRHRGSNEPR